MTGGSARRLADSGSLDLDASHEMPTASVRSLGWQLLPWAPALLRPESALDIDQDRQERGQLAHLGERGGEGAVWGGLQRANSQDRIDVGWAVAVREVDPQALQVFVRELRLDAVRVDRYQPSFTRPSPI